MRNSYVKSDQIIISIILCLLSSILLIGSEEKKPATMRFKEDVYFTKSLEEDPGRSEKTKNEIKSSIKSNIRKQDYPEDTGRMPSLKIFFQGNPEVQYLGFIVAQKLGYYTKAGLPEVSLLWMNEFQDAMDLLMLGQADFSSTWMIEGYLARAQGTPIVAISQTAQRTSCGISIKKTADPAINDIQQLEGKRVGIWVKKEGVPRFFFAHKKVVPHFVVQNPSSLFLIKKGVMDALFYTSYSTKILTDLYHFPDTYSYLDFHSFGINIPEDTIFCRESFLKKYPDLCEKLIRISYEGWKYVVDHPNESIEILRDLRSRFNLITDPFLLKKQLSAWMEILMFNDDLEQNGNCSRDGFALMRAGLINNGTLHKDAPFYEEFFYNILDPKERERLKKVSPQNE